MGSWERTEGIYRLSKRRVLAHLLTQLECLPCNYLCLELMDLIQPKLGGSENKISDVIG